jgi:hypothetical protein
MHRLTVEGHRDGDMAAAVQMDLDAGAADMVAHEALFIDGLVAILEIDQRFRIEAVPFDERELDEAERMIVAGFEMRNLADSVALIEDIDKGHGSALLRWGSGVRPLRRSPPLHQVIGKGGGTRKAGGDFL